MDERDLYGCTDCGIHSCLQNAQCFAPGFVKAGRRNTVQQHYHEECLPRGLQRFASCRVKEPQRPSRFLHKESYDPTQHEVLKQVLPAAREFVERAKTVPSSPSKSASSPVWESHVCWKSLAGELFAHRADSGTRDDMKNAAQSTRTMQASTLQEVELCRCLVSLAPSCEKLFLTAPLDSAGSPLCKPRSNWQVDFQSGGS